MMILIHVLKNAKKLNMITNQIIKEKLSKEDARELLSLCRTYYPMPLGTLEISENLRNDFEESSPRIYYSEHHRKLENLRKTHTLYQKMGVNENEYMIHWMVSFKEQKELHYSYGKQSKPERKDNKDYLNKGNGTGYVRDIRKPKKARKTAWKRFYRLFPSLDPKNKKE
jgi:hypothetical protein